NGLGPSYIANSLVKYLPSRTLRSSNAGLLEVPSKIREKIGDAAFVNYAPVLWNILPIDIREASSLNIFFCTISELCFFDVYFYVHVFLCAYYVFAVKHFELHSFA